MVCIVKASISCGIDYICLHTLHEYNRAYLKREPLSVYIKTNAHLVHQDQNLIDG